MSFSNLIIIVFCFLSYSVFAGDNQKRFDEDSLYQELLKYKKTGLATTNMMSDEERKRAEEVSKYLNEFIDQEFGKNNLPNYYDEDQSE